MLVICVLLLWLCMIAGAYLVLDWLLEQHEEKRLKPQRRKRPRSVQPADGYGAATFVKG
jgi:hypothetical protein